MSNETILAVFCLKKTLLETTIIAQKVYFGMFCFFATLCNNWGLGEQ